MISESFSGPYTDLWALGVITYQMLVGDFPFKGKTSEEVFGRIKQANIDFPDDLNETAKAFIKGLLQLSPLDRLGYHSDD